MVLGPSCPRLMLLHALFLLLLLLLLMILDEVTGFAEDDDGAEHAEGEEANVRQEGDCNRALTDKLFKSQTIQQFF